MAPYSLTLSFNTAEELREAVNRLAPRVLTEADAAADLAGLPRLGQIAPADRPDVGAPGMSISAPPVAPNPFAPGAAQQIIPLADARSTAGVVAPPIAPVAPPATSPDPATVFAPPASTAPTAAAPTAPVGPTTPALDVQGLPWDGRIHASTKTFNADKTWRQKRNLDAAVKLQVETELRQTMAARAPSSTPVASAAPVAPPPTVPAPPAAAPAAPAAGETLGQVMARLGPIFAAGDAVKVGKINAALGAFGLGSLAGLASRADLVAPFAAMVDASLAQA